jgi:hypothetical protein
VDAFTPEEVEALKSEPMLVVQELDVPDPRKSPRTASRCTPRGRG